MPFVVETLIKKQWEFNVIQKCTVHLPLNERSQSQLFVNVELHFDDSPSDSFVDKVLDSSAVCLYMFSGTTCS